MKKLIVFVFLFSFTFNFSNQDFQFGKTEKNESVYNEIAIKNESGFKVECAVVDGLDMIIAKVIVGAYKTVTVDVGTAIEIRVYYKGSLSLDYEYQAGKDAYSYTPTYVIESEY